ncbi:cyclin-L1-like isoform X1 [Branchiostoma lanceolatum]|uniref:cyclin-L1-like isoform X1 n=2 Tax=Branchiostoma lanceolatum TaxID=7740 RepID=UPI003454D7CF
MANAPFKIGDKEFSGVVITLENCLLPTERLDATPSVNDGLEHETEVDLRILGCEYIQTAGVLLRLPQTAMATGQVLFQRFFYSKSLVKHNMEIVAMACVYLASKIEEAPRRIRDTINVFHHIRQRRNNRPAQPLILDQNYINTKNQVIKAERRVLKELGFCVHVKHPHKLIVMYLQVLDCEKNRKLVQTAWNFMNDSLRTDVFVRFSPETIACACIFLAARQLKVPLPNRAHCPCHWYELFGASEEEVQEISLMILKIYARDKKNYEDLDKEVEKRRKVLQEAKLRARGLLDDQGRPVDSTTGNSSPSSRPTSPKTLSAKPSPVRDASSDKKVKREDGASSGSAHSHKENRGGRDRSRSRSSRSRSRSPRRKARSQSGSSRSSSRSRSDSGSRSRSRSPTRNGHHARLSPPRDRNRERRSHDRHKRALSGKRSHAHKRRRTRSPISRSRSRSRSRSHSRSPDRYSRKHYHKERPRHPSRSRSRERNKAAKHSSHSRDRHGRRR